MKASAFRRCIPGLATVVVFGALFVTFGSSEQQQPQRVRPPGQPIAMPSNPVALEIILGRKDEKPTPWDGEIKVSAGRVLEVEVLRGNPKAKVDGARFTVSSVSRNVQKKKVVDGPILRVSLDAPPTARVIVQTKQGNAELALADLADGEPKTFLDGMATAERSEGAVRLTGRDTEDDYPALARASDGSAWLAYVEYVPGKPIVMERVVAGGFEELMPSGNGDQVRLVHFDGKTWQPALDVTEPALSVWRPAVAVDGKGVVIVAWAQTIDGDWEICYRRYTPAKDGAGKWSDVVRLTKEPGADFHVVATTDSAGVVWLAWQAWRKDNFEILLAALADDHPWKQPKVISNSSANDWTPTITADSRGNVFVAWDTYDRGNYDVRLATIARGAATAKVIDVASTPRFEARPSIVCDARDRVWIAYEEGDEQWGKDNAGRQYKNVGLKSNPGYALYINRTLQVKCLVDGRLMKPAAALPAGDPHRGTLEQPSPEGRVRNRSLPRLALDGAGGIWLLYRQHPLPSGGGEVWNSYALRYDGRKWSAPRRLSGSANLMDNRPALLPFAKGVLTVYSGDARRSTANRGQDDLFATILTAAGETQAPELVADAPTSPQNVAVVHPQETADIARVREYRVPHGDGQLRLWRGEFHRHTEYSSHQDQDGMLEDAWRYGIDAGGLDWIGVGDHSNGYASNGDGSRAEYMWWQFQKVTELFQHPPRFLAVHTYERSAVYPNGHRNIIVPKRGIRPLPYLTKGPGQIQPDPGTPEKGSDDTKLLYAYLKHFGGICASHTSATRMGTDWRDNHAEMEPIVEIYQGLRHNYEHFGAPRSATKETQIGGYEPAGFVWNALEKGYRFGFQASSDHISTHMSYAVVLAPDSSRQGLIDAFRKRHCYAATDNIILDVRSGANLMGDAFTTAKRPALDIVVQGTGPIAKLSVIRDNKYVYTAEPKKREVKLTYTDLDARPGATSYYYVRIEQADGNLAWASPIWITYKP